MTENALFEGEDGVEMTVLPCTISYPSPVVSDHDEMLVVRFVNVTVP